MVYCRKRKTKGYGKEKYVLKTVCILLPRCM